MTVGLVGSYPPPHGGQAVHIRNLALYLRSHGVEVDVLNTGSSKSLQEPGIINIGSARALLTTLLFGRRYRLLHVHVSFPTDLGKLLPVSVAAAIRGTPWVATIHSGNSPERLRTASASQRMLTRMVLRSAARIVCVNENIRNSIAALIGSRTAVVVPPHSVNLAIAPPPAPVAAFIAEHAPAIACIGLFEPTYGFEEAVRLMPELLTAYPRAGLLLIGDQRNAAWCRSLIDELGLQKHVMICGNIGHDECLGTLKASTLFLRPTRYDGDSLSVREALAMGMPVVATTTDFRPPGVVLYRADAPGDLAEKVLATLRSATRSTADAVGDSNNLEQVHRLYQQLLPT